MGKSAPAPGNYTGAAQQTADASKANVNQQTQQNRANTSGPLGTQTWTTGPDGRPQLTQGYSQGIQGTANELQGAAQNAWATPLDNGTDARNQTINSAYNYATSRLDPQWRQQEQLSASSLANQGLDPNSAAARAANLQQSQAKNEAYGGAMNGAIQAGNAAGSQVFQNNMAARNAPLQQLLGLAGGAGQTPQYNAAGQAQAPDMLAATMGQDAANMRNWQAQQQANAQLINGLGSLGGSIAGSFFGLGSK